MPSFGPLHSAQALWSPWCFFPPVPSPHTLQFTLALGSSVLFELQTSATKLFLPPSSLSRHSASLNYRVYPLTTGWSRQCQPFTDKVHLCEGKHPEHCAKKESGWFFWWIQGVPSLPHFQKTLKAGIWYSKWSIKLSQPLNDSEMPSAGTDVPMCIQQID